MSINEYAARMDSVYDNKFKKVVEVIQIMK